MDKVAVMLMNGEGDPLMWPCLIPLPFPLPIYAQPLHSPVYQTEEQAKEEVVREQTSIHPRDWTVVPARRAFAFSNLS